MPAVPPFTASGYRLDEVTEQLYRHERALFVLLGDLRPLLDALRGPQRTRELESAAATALDVGQLLDSALRHLVTARVTFATEAALEAKARMLVSITDAEGA